MTQFLAGDTVELIEEFMYGESDSLPIGTTGHVVEDSGLNTTRVSFGELGKMWLLSDSLKLIAHHPDRVQDTMTTSDQKPAVTEIDATTFYLEGYAGKIERGECVVTWVKSDKTKVGDVIKTNPVFSNWQWDYKIISPEGGEFGLDEHEARFKVTWLPVTPLPATVGDGEAVLHKGEFDHLWNDPKAFAKALADKHMGMVSDAVKEWAGNALLDTSPLTTEERLMLAVEGNTLLMAQITSLHRELATAKALRAAGEGTLCDAAVHAYNCLDAVYEAFDGDFGNKLSTAIPKTCEELKTAIEAYRARQAATDTPPAGERDGG